MDHPQMRSLRGLPFEVLGLIIAELDVHSMKSLIIAQPWLKGVTIIVSEEVDSDIPDESAFFDLDGVDRCTFDQMISHQAMLSTQKLIKLYELDTTKPKCNILVSGKVAMSKLVNVLDQLSFVHVRGLLFNSTSTYCDNMWVILTGLFGKGSSKTALSPNFRESQLHLDNFINGNGNTHGHQPFVMEIFDAQYGALPFQPTDNRYKKLSIDVHGDKLRGIRGVALEELNINVYGAGRTRPVTICDIYAPNLAQFKVTYSGSMPLMDNLKIALVSGPEVTFPTGRYFELLETTTSKFASANRGFGIDKISKRSHYSRANFSFMRNFTDVCISGAPDFLLEDILGGERLLQLMWYKTMQFEDRRLGTTELGINAPRIVNIFIFNTIPDFKLPSIKRLQALKSAYIVSMAPGFDPNKESDILRARSLEIVNIVCDLDRHNCGGPGHIVLSKEDLSNLSDLFLTQLHIEGCYFGVNNSLLVYQIPHTLKWADMEFLEIVFVRQKSETHAEINNTLTVKLLGDIPMFFLEKLTLCQIVYESVTQRWDRLVYSLHPEMNRRDITNIVTDFDSTEVIQHD